MDNKLHEINELESSLDNIAHVLISADYLSGKRLKEMYDEYYRFRRLLHVTLKEEHPDFKFENF